MQTGYTNVPAVYRKEMHSVAGGKGMWVGIEMENGQEKRFIDKAVRPHTTGGGTLRA